MQISLRAGTDLEAAQMAATPPSTTFRILPIETIETIDNH